MVIGITVLLDENSKEIRVRGEVIEACHVTHSASLAYERTASLSSGPDRFSVFGRL